MKHLLIATHNQGKVKEFRELLRPKDILVTSAAEHNLPEPVEDGDSFAANALIKARAAAKATGLPALSDDSGLCVNFLGGAPGIFSARWAGDEKDFTAAMTRIHAALGESEDRFAHFTAVLALVTPDGAEHTFDGKCEGTLVWPPRGDGGHGYDPMFLPRGQTKTFAQMRSTDKHKFSHRAKALAKFITYIETTRGILQ